VAAELLRAHGITVFSDGQIPQLLAWMALNWLPQVGLPSVSNAA
jgi:hypothetical protein